MQQSSYGMRDFEYIFNSPNVREVMDTALRVARCDAPVLLCGETGTGKEVLAEIIHGNSSRRHEPFVAVNCAAIPRELMESEMFGAAKGAFTGAAERKGLTMQADKGTLFLDELAEMPPELQCKMLRVLQDKRVRKIGGKSAQDADFRVISTINAEPHMLIESRKLRSDLFYRLNTVILRLPPLRARQEDILPLAEMFLKTFTVRANYTEPVWLNMEVRKAFLTNNWPGNVRQLQNEMERLVALGYTGEISLSQLSPELSNVSMTEGLCVMDSLEKTAIIATIHECHNNVTRAARRLGIGRQTLYNKLDKYRIEVVTRRKRHPIDSNGVPLANNGNGHSDGISLQEPEYRLPASV